MNKQKSVFILAISSDIGFAYAVNMLSKGYLVSGTYRIYTPKLAELEQQGVKLFECDISIIGDIDKFLSIYQSQNLTWDILMLATGDVSPVSAFLNCDFDEWENSLRVNFLHVLRFCHGFLHFRNKDSLHGALVVFFSGSGSNSAPLNYSAYTISKIALTKACELLNEEIEDCRFTIVGPGVINTKIHKPTIEAANNSGGAYNLLSDKIKNNECTPMEELMSCLNRLEALPKKMVGGRNFSVVYDKWMEEEFGSFLSQDPNIYKLRRYGNNFVINNGKNK